MQNIDLVFFSSTYVIVVVILWVERNPFHILIIFFLFVIGERWQLFGKMYGRPRRILIRIF